MSIQSEINRINSNVQSALNAVADTGVSVPEGANSDNLPVAVSALVNEKQDKLTGTQGQVVGFDENGNAVAQNAPSGGGGVGRTATLTSSGWIANSVFGFEQTVSVTGVTTSATQVITVDVALSLTDKDANVAMLDAWALVAQCPAKQNSGSITFYAVEQPNVSISLAIGVGG